MASLSEDGQDICDSEVDENSTKSDNGNDVPKSKSFDQSFSTKTWREDMTLVVQGKHLYVSSTVLSLLSPVFTTMFEEAFEGDGPREIELEGKKYDDMVQFLRCLYPNIQQNVDLDNVFVVLPLAVEFGTKLLKERCNTFLLTQLTHVINAEELCQYLIKVQTMDLPEVREQCLCLLSEKSYDDVLKAENKFPLPLDVKVELQHRLIKSKDRKLDQLEKMLRQFNLKQAWFEKSQQSIKDFKNGCVGYLEYSCSLRKGIREESPAISVHGIDWSLGVREVVGKAAIYLMARPPKQRNSWSCRVFAKLLEYSEHDLYCSFTEHKCECQFQKRLDIDTTYCMQRQFTLKFFVEEPTQKIDQ